VAQGGTAENVPSGARNSTVQSTAVDGICRVEAPVRSDERAGVVLERLARVGDGSGTATRPIAMKITGHKTEAVYRRYAIVNEADVAEGLARLASFLEERPAADRA